MSLIRIMLTVIALCVVPSLAQAQVSADDLGLGVVSGAQWGKNKPTIILHPNISVGALRFDCQRSDGQKVGLSSGAIKAGGEKRIVIPQGKGVFQWKCAVTGKAGKGSFGPFALDFETKVGEPPKIDVKPSDVDEANHQITVRLSEPCGRIDLDIVGDDGKAIDNAVLRCKGEAPGTPLVVPWKQKEAEVMGHFSLRAYDPAGFFNGIESLTFVDIPHEDIVFESGKWDIRASEEGKLLAPLSDIVAQLKKVAGVIQIELYIGGYTDTVGNPADNAELSRKRAQAIAQWFVSHGVQVPIHFQGFGESVLAVPTPDNTDELRNRRASYVLATQPPPASRGFPTKNWGKMGKQ